MKALLGPSTLLIALATFPAPTELSEVCYSYLGCFSMDDPWYSLWRPLPTPQSPGDIDTQFYLYTHNQPARYVVSKLPNISFSAGSDYLGSRPTYFLVQGYISNPNQLWILAMKDAIIKEFDANVFIVDWSKGSTQVNYLQVASNARVVGAELIRLANFLVSYMGASVSRFHCIGHSIGAHVCGYMGKSIPSFARITALEAAKPAFEGYPTSVRLAKSDAVFVEAIHTNAQPLIPTLGFGYMFPIGHVDYYVNGGTKQPGCIIPPVSTIPINALEDLGKVAIDVLVRWVFCSHALAFYMFTSSIGNTGCTFWGHRADYLSMSLSIMSGGYLTQYMDLGECTKDTCSPMGLQASNYTARGVFLVKATGSSPYCIPDQHNDDIMAKYKKSPPSPI